MRQFGNGVGRVATTVLAMECAAEDAGYLKMLLTKLYTDGKPQYGIFILTGFHLVTSAENFKAALRKQNAFLQSVNMVFITGISNNAMWKYI
eukprot:11161652-Ditylum_brightwellii.AAC.1